MARERCAFPETNIHKGEEGFTSAVFKAIGYPGAENDTTVIKRDLGVRRNRGEEPWATGDKYNLYGLDGTTSWRTGREWLIVGGE